MEYRKFKSITARPAILLVTILAALAPVAGFGSSRAGYWLGLIRLIQTIARTIVRGQPTPRLSMQVGD
jgi:hypothetical protein